MADTIKMEDIAEKAESTSETAEQAETAEIAETSEQGPLKTELERVQKTGRTEAEKAAFNLRKNAERAKELGIDVSDVLGFGKPAKAAGGDAANEDDKPFTVGMYRKLEQERAFKTALQTADDIPNETERELVKFHLNNTIRSTGNPSEDLKMARAIVNSVKNSQIIEEAGRKTPAKAYSNSSGADAKQEKEIVYTPDELTMMKAPFNMTPQEILGARAGKKFAFKK